MTAPAPLEDPVVASIKANIVFEKMIASVLAATVFAAVIRFGISFGGGAGSALLSAATFALLFFFTAFAVSVAVGVPLYLQLEKAKLRKAWPYALAAALVSLLVLTALGAAPSFEAPWCALYLVPGVIAALLFARKMRPFWAAAERADAAPAARAVARLH
jgi:hypothetical protein